MNIIDKTQTGLLVLFWLITNSLAIITSSIFIQEPENATDAYNSFSTGDFRSFRWLELTIVQQLFSAIVLIIWNKCVKKESVEMKEGMLKIYVGIATVGNIIGSLALNATYSTGSTNTVQFIRCWEPLFTFVLVMYFYSMKERVNSQLLVSILNMCIAVAIVVWNQPASNYWVLTFGLIANIAIPMRNIYLLKIINQSSSSLQQSYTVILTYSALILLPLLSIKLAFTQSIPIGAFSVSVTCVILYFAYEITSMTILLTFNPIKHSILSLLMRVLLVFILQLYQHNQQIYSFKVLALVALCLCLIHYNYFSSKEEDKGRLSKFPLLLFLILATSIIICTNEATKLSQSFFNSTKYKFIHFNKPTNESTQYEFLNTVRAFNKQSHESVVGNLSEYHNFHMIFTTSTESKISVFGDPSSKMTGSFNWKHKRSLESVFHHYPLSRVIIHSNTLLQSQFDVFTESGYSVVVEEYDLIQMIMDSPARSFTIEKLEKAKQGTNWYSHETDFLRFLILYKYGGIYMDTDIIIVRPFDDLGLNVLGQEDTNQANGAFMIFERDHPFIEACLKKAADSYTGMHWGEIGPDLLSKVYFNWPGGPEKSGVRLLKQNTFYLFHYLQLTLCYKDVEGPAYESKWKELKEEAYVVHLYSKTSAYLGKNGLKEGTICKHLLNNYCVFCNEVY